MFKSMSIFRSMYVPRAHVKVALERFCSSSFFSRFCQTNLLLTMSIEFLLGYEILPLKSFWVEVNQIGNRNLWFESIPDIVETRIWQFSNKSFLPEETWSLIRKLLGYFPHSIHAYSVILFFYSCRILFTLTNTTSQSRFFYRKANVR